jgi:hypothetical protein
VNGTVVIATGDTSATPEFAGSTWVRLQYLLGFERLGFRTYWIDRLGRVEPRRTRRSAEYFATRFDQTARTFEFADRYSIVYQGGESYFGMGREQIDDLIGDADLLLTIGAKLPADCPLLRIARRAYLDVDPGFTQAWALDWDLGLDRHHVLFTVGQSVGRPDFVLPIGGRRWHVTLPPVVLEQWPVANDRAGACFTSVGDWRTKQLAEYQGESFGDKRSEFLRFLTLPRQSARVIELALCIGAADFDDIRRLCEHGWHLVNPAIHTGDPLAYREFIRYSRGELSVAKNGYVKSRSGWISDRTPCYLASGKPAIVQSTGFEHALPVGEGLLTFDDLHGAIACLERVDADYERHCAAARALATTYFDSDRVLRRMLERAGL